MWLIVQAPVWKFHNMTTPMTADRQCEWVGLKYYQRRLEKTKEFCNARNSSRRLGNSAIKQFDNTASQELSFSRVAGSGTATGWEYLGLPGIYTQNFQTLKRGEFPPAFKKGGFPPLCFHYVSMLPFLSNGGEPLLPLLSCCSPNRRLTTTN